MFSKHYFNFLASLKQATLHQFLYLDIRINRRVFKFLYFLLEKGFLKSFQLLEEKQPMLVVRMYFHNFIYTPRQVDYREISENHNQGKYRRKFQKNLIPERGFFPTTQRMNSYQVQPFVSLKVYKKPKHVTLKWLKKK